MILYSHEFLESFKIQRSVVDFLRLHLLIFYLFVLNWRKLLNLFFQQRETSDHERGTATCQEYSIAHFINIHKKLNVQIN